MPPPSSSPRNKTSRLQTESGLRPPNYWGFEITETQHSR